jgi:hypothetical protein
LLVHGETSLGSFCPGASTEDWDDEEGYYVAQARHGATRDTRHGATRDQTFTSFTLKLGYATVAVGNFNGFDVTAVPAPAKMRQIMESMPHVWTKSWKHHSMVLCVLVK